jgi:hypothetical protein
MDYLLSIFRKHWDQISCTQNESLNNTGMSDEYQDDSLLDATQL